MGAFQFSTAADSFRQMTPPLEHAIVWAAGAGLILCAALSSLSYHCHQLWQRHRATQQRVGDVFVSVTGLERLIDPQSTISASEDKESPGPWISKKDEYEVVNLQSLETGTEKL